MPVKVSVVVPVYNPGVDIVPGFESFMAQTLPADEFEVLYVDDGSTDDTPAWLARTAAEHPNVRVITIPNSGWPGRPRNIGIREARGEYIHLVDQDDRLAPDALRRLYEMGRRNGSDVVIGKVASNFRPNHHIVFKEDRETCRLADGPLVHSLTPHKMFRAAFLREKGLAFPEGRWIREDQLFMTQLYLADPVVSILASYTCYFYWRRTTGVNNADSGITPDESTRNLATIMDAVVQALPEGDVRDRFLTRFFRSEILGSLFGASKAGKPVEDFEGWYEYMGPVARHFLSDGVYDRVGALYRVALDLLAEDRPEALRQWGAFIASVKASGRLESLEWTADGRTRIGVTGGFVHGDAREPLCAVERDGRVLLDPDLVEKILPGLEVDLTGELDGLDGEVLMRNRDDSVQWGAPTAVTPKLEPLDDGRLRIAVTGEALVGTEAEQGHGRPARGFWDLLLIVDGIGMRRESRFGADRAADVEALPRPALLGSPARPVVPYFTDPQGNLTLDVGRRGRRLADHLAGRPVRRAEGAAPVLVLDLPATADAAMKAVLLVESPSGAKAEAPVVLRAAEGRAVLQVPRVDGGEPGKAALSVRLDGPDRPALPLCDARLRPDGTVVLDESVPAVRITVPRTEPGWIRARLRGLRRRLRRPATAS